MLICRKIEIMEYFSIKIKFSVDTCYSRTLLYWMSNVKLFKPNIISLWVLCSKEYDFVIPVRYLSNYMFAVYFSMSFD